MNEWNQKKKLLFIYNPRAGKEKIRSNFLDIIDILQRQIMKLRCIRHSHRETGERQL